MKIGLVLVFSALAQALPLVLLHGMMSTNTSMSEVASWAAASFPGIYIANLQPGGSSKWDAVFANLTHTCESLAALIKADPNLQQGFNAIGHSQGGLLLRCYVERFMHLPGYPQMQTFVSYLGVQDGVFGIPEVNSFCPEKDKLCMTLIALFDEFLINPKYSFELQGSITFAAFWKDVMHYQDYLKYNNFLADLNNERNTKNAQYRLNMMKLKNYVCFYGLLDKIVVPNQSPIFSFFAPGNVSNVVPFAQSGQYSENGTGDWLGLKTLQDRGALHFHSVNCTHSGAITASCKNDIWPQTVPYLK